MPTIEEVLRHSPEPLPEWLDSDEPPCFEREAFFESRTVYYPGSGDDGQPVKFCARSRAAHCFIYVDQRFDRDILLARLRDKERGFRGYAIVHQELVSRDVLWPRGWTSHVSADEVRNSAWRNDRFVELFGWFVVLDRQEGDEDHGPRRLAILFIVGDGFDCYDALYCQGDGTPPPYLAVIQDCGFGGNHGRFDRGGLLEKIARSSRVWPSLLLVARNSRPWPDYVDTGGVPEPGGSGRHPRRLYRRRRS